MELVLVSLPSEEARAMRAAWKFLLKFSRDGRRPVAQKEARDILRHFPLGGDLEAAAQRYAPELLGKVSREADQLAQEAAREASRADAAEKQLDPVPTIPPYLNVP